jgi:ribosomal protein S16
MWIIVSGSEGDGNYIHTVGHYNPKGEFIPLEDFSTKERATEYVHYLNGGNLYEEVR